jgi:cyclopropane fatty-acyl-phospholipid synthase-like methyltransferase
MNVEKDYSDYWLNHWEEKSKVKDNISASGWGSKDIKEYLYDIKDICKKLQLERKDRLLNIGCGSGLMEILLSYWVRSITSVDFSKGMVERAKKNNKGHKNVIFYKANILNLTSSIMKCNTYGNMLS